MCAAIGFRQRGLHDGVRPSIEQPDAPAVNPQGSIRDLIATGESRYLEQLRESMPEGLLDMLEIPGMTPAAVSLLRDLAPSFPLTLRDIDGYLLTDGDPLEIVTHAKLEPSVRGAVPGHKNGHVVVSPAIKVKVKKGAN